MSLSIDIDTVGKVLIAGTWYEVIDASFELDSYEYVQKWQNWDQHKEMILYNGTYDLQSKNNITEEGCCFKTKVNNELVDINAPMSSVQAIAVTNDLKGAKIKEMEAELKRAIKANREAKKK